MSNLNVELFKAQDLHPKREPDYCVPFYTDPNGKAVALNFPLGDTWEPMRFTLEQARREVMLVRSGVRWWDFPANCIVRVYLK
jgi:hypothetical protein